MAVDPISNIAGAIREGFKLVALAMSGSEKRRMRKAINYGENFIRRWEMSTPKEDRDKKLENIAEDFFRVNN